MITNPSSLEKIFELRTVASLNQHKFNVPNYQRGYKWDAQQVNDLLEDIQSDDPEKQYCLQPLVLKKLDSFEYELIDGQQRCTTIFIILSSLPGVTPNFSIIYQTRPASEDFLLKISSIEPINFDDKKDLEEQIKNAWDEFARKNPAKDNVDNYHFFNALFTVRRWAAAYTPEATERFIKKLTNFTSFIWYEIDNNETAETVFQHFNSGKIPLTAAELIKSLLVIQLQQETNIEIRQLKINKFALEWEQMERALQEKDFWYYLNGNNEDRATRLDLLFELQSKKVSSKQNPLYCYYQYAAKFEKKENLSEEWINLVKIYQNLTDWFNKTKVYHLIGFLTNSGLANLHDILKINENITLKKNFEKGLQSTLIKKLEKQKLKDGKNIAEYAIDNLDFIENKNAVRIILLLFNVLFYERQLPEEKFPFWRYNDEDWSIEHIHPQSPKSQKTIVELKSWLTEQCSLLDPADKMFDAITSIQQSIQSLEDSGVIPTKVREEVAVIADTLAENFDLHKIGNLALLDRNTNSKIGNKPFLTKRKLIFQITNEESSSYIPLATRNVFLKSFTNATDKLPMTFWNENDANDYTDYITDILKEYLPKPIL